MRRWVPGGGLRHDGTLHGRVLRGRDGTVVLLHGLVGSNRYWSATYDGLAPDRTVVALDLLGFGRSPKPDAGYSADDQAAAVEAALDEIDAPPPFTVVGHSAGSVVALRLAHRRPELVTSVVGFGPPLYASAAAARGHLASMGPMARLFALPGPLAERTCRWVCEHRSVAAWLAVVTHPRLPAPVARDSVQHRWPSYRRTMEDLVLAVHDDWAASVEARVRIVVGDRDRVVDHRHLDTLAAAAGWSTSRWNGGHHLPLRDAPACAALIARASGGAPRPGG